MGQQQRTLALSLLILSAFTVFAWLAPVGWAQTPSDDSEDASEERALVDDAGSEEAQAADEPQQRSRDDRPGNGFADVREEMADGMIDPRRYVQGFEAFPFPEEPVAGCTFQDAPLEHIRSNYMRRGGQDRPARHAADARHRAWTRYRTEHYGYFEGFGESEWNAHTPAENSEATRFMGRSIRMNAQVLPALACVEVEIQRSCGEHPYTPGRLSGLRHSNTFRGGEVSNHVYGLAIDLDPDDNTCCKCTARWREHPMCQQEVDSIYERMIMPECWVHAFERYGFYWLGHDRLQDTMHFEFLADPALVTPPDVGSVPGE